MKAKIILIMGVSSSGKTTIGEMLARKLGWAFFDGDAFHSPENVEKMRKGIALDDQDRLPWLRNIRSKIEIERERGSGAIFACSALKESYRQVLIEGIDSLCLVYLKASKEKLHERALVRVHQYMPASLLESQLETLEVPADAITVSVEGSLEETFRELMGKLDC